MTHSKAEVQRIVAEHPNRFGALVATLSYAGITLADIAKLRPEDFRISPPRLPGTDASRSLTSSQTTQLLASIEDAPAYTRTTILLSLFCGLRQIEIRRLRWSDQEITTEGHVYFRVRGKGGKDRIAYLPKSVYSAVRACRRHEDAQGFILTSPGRENASVSENTVRGIIDTYLKPIAPDSTAHCLRHTLITALLNTGATLEEAMEIAGHSEAGSHELYAAADDGWFISSWQAHHPLAGWRSNPGVSHVYISGDPRSRRMSRGTERVVPIPTWVLVEYAQEIQTLGNGTWTSKRLSKMFDGRPYGPASLREAGAVHMAESGAHPFLLSLVLGITPDWVLIAKFDRRGEIAENGRIAAVERAVARMERIEQANEVKQFA